MKLRNSCRRTCILNHFTASFRAGQMRFFQIQKHLLQKKIVNRSQDDTDNAAVLQEEDWLYYLALQVFLQHLWNGMLQHLLISKLVKNPFNTSSVRQPVLIWTLCFILIYNIKVFIYHSNIHFAQKLHYIHNPVEGRFVLFKVLRHLLSTLQ